MRQDKGIHHWPSVLPALTGSKYRLSIFGFSFPFSFFGSLYNVTSSIFIFLNSEFFEGIYIHTMIQQERFDTMPGVSEGDGIIKSIPLSKSLNTKKVHSQNPNPNFSTVFTPRDKIDPFKDR